MKMRRHFLIGVVLTVLTMSLQAQTGDAEKQVRAAEEARVTALDRGDVAALDHLLADDLTYVHASGRVDTKSSLLAAVRSGELHYISWTPKTFNVRLLGPTAALIDGEYNVRVTDARKHQDPLDVNVFFLGIYALRNGSWQQVAWQSTRRP